MTKRNEQELVRFEKLRELRERGFNFPNDVTVTATSKKILEMDITDSPEKGTRLTLAGRIVQMRLMGKAAFCHILDEDGKVQLYLKKDTIGDEQFESFKHLDIGDIIETKGYAFVTKTGEKSLFVESLRLLVKSLIPLPEKWHGLSDVEVRYRQRYVDLIANPEVRDVFRERARIIAEIRQFLNARSFVEVETPILHYIAGGANAKPFLTYHNALDSQMNLRIALELPLKKLVVGGLEKVYEIGRNFRNEGISKKHNPEFTMLEFYWGYATFHDLMDFTEEMIGGLVHTIAKGTSLSYLDHTIDFSRPWKKISMFDSIYEIGGVTRDVDLNSVGAIQRVAAHHRIELADKDDWGRGIEALWGDLVEAKLINPTFITHHPFSISPLARKSDSNPLVTDRFELIVAGMEMANGFSELNDAEDQRARFEAQAERKALGDEEATEVDEDYLRALEYGLPPTAGEGVGIDRLVMLLTNSPSIRDILLFPQLKPLKEDEEN